MQRQEGRPDHPLNDDEVADSFGLFKAAVEAIADAIVVTSPDLALPGPRIEYVNPAFCRMTGYAPEEVIGQTPRMFQGTLTDRAELVRLKTSLMAGEPFHGEVVNYRKDGQPHVIEWLVTAIRGDDGAVLRWLSVQRDVTRRKQLEHHQELLIDELHHRTRNLLTVVGAIAARTLPRSLEREAFEDRLAALSRVQGFLSNGSTWSVPLAELINAELEAVGGSGLEQTTIAGPSIDLPGDKIQPLALTLHELVTNAVKYGALSQPEGRLAIRWDTGPDGRLTLTWRENGVALADPSPRRGFGLDQIERSTRYQLEAETTHEFLPDGVLCTIILPGDAFR